MKIETIEPWKMSKRWELYDSEHHCFVEEIWTTQLYYDSYYIAKRNSGSEEEKGWWVYRTIKQYNRKPVSNPSIPGYASMLNSLPSSEITVIPATGEPYYSDALRRRKESANNSSTMSMNEGNKEEN